MQISKLKILSVLLTSIGISSIIVLTVLRHIKIKEEKEDVSLLNFFETIKFYLF